MAISGVAVRLGNLMNSEIYGTVTSLPWGFIFVRDGETLPKHPTPDLRSALLPGAVHYPVVDVLQKDTARRRPGLMFGFFLIVLFGTRFLIEFIKNPQEDFEVNMLLNMGQLLSIPFILTGIVILWVRIAQTSARSRTAEKEFFRHPCETKIEPPNNRDHGPNQYAHIQCPGSPPEH